MCNSLINFSQSTRMKNQPFQLLCFPYAGGGASIYRHWAKLFPQIEILAVKLPGKESRFNEEPINNSQQLVEHLFQDIIKNINKPFVFFGHSMGGILAYELAHLMQKKGTKMPSGIIISSRAAPHTLYDEEKIAHLPFELFFKKIIKKNGIPKEIANNEAFLKMIEPALRADFELCENHINHHKAPLNIPLLTIGGDKDQDIPEKKLNAWNQYFSSSVKNTILSGGHFHINDQSAHLISLIKGFTSNIQNTWNCTYE